jgi:hypothetical protein
MPASTKQTGFSLTLDAVQRVELLRLLEREIRDTHMEARRTESPNFQDEVHHREDVLNGLINKLRAPSAIAQ